MGGSDRRPDWVRQLGMFGVIVTDVVGYTSAGIAVGYLAWNKLGAPWWMIVITSMAGLGLAMYQVYRLTRREMNGRNRDGNRNGL